MSKEKLKEYDIKYKENHRELLRQKARIYRKENPKHNSEYQKRPEVKERQKQLRNRPEFIEKRKQYLLSIKLKVFSHYCGGINKIKCQCTKCNISIIRMLTIDHINGDAHKNRHQGVGIALCLWIIRNNFPEGFQVLCWNCNCTKGTNRACAHYD
ncbi:MAG: hypothetical protein KGI05_08235 [Thaumarchaeota archaeon]|nr:hypothetical protein [Nitrososphaerota archaeon]